MGAFDKALEILNRKKADQKMLENMGNADVKSTKNQFNDFVNLFDTSVVKMQEKFKRMHNETE
jgi:hypothetical protein